MRRTAKFAGRLCALVCLISLLFAAAALADDSSACGGDCRQVMLSMAYAANLSAGIELTDPMENRVERLTKVTAARMDCALAGATALAGKGWQRTWGPVLVLEPNTQVLQTTAGPVTLINTWDPAPVANTMFVAKKKGANVYVVAIAGTNSASDFDWVDEDFDAYPVVWPYGWHFDTVRVTRGTLTGLGLLQSMQSNGKSLEDYLKSLVASDKATFFFTGHSLGGALAPATALWLHDKHQSWDPNGNATLKIFAFAGATPGDRAFASYTGKRFQGDDLVVVNNSLDVVPHAFNLDTLGELSTLYEDDPTACQQTPQAQKCIEPSAAESAAINEVISKVTTAANNNIYFQTLGDGSQVQGFTGDLLSRDQLANVSPMDCPLYALQAPKFDDYGKEALYQHVCAYPSKLGVPKLSWQMAQCVMANPGS